MNYDAILLTSFGGPEGPDEVMPFLERVTAGRGVPRERLEEVSHHYLALGGVSPINDQNRALLAEMRKEFASRSIDLPIYWGNRNSDPYFADALKEIYTDGHRNVLALVTSAYSSYSGCRQYRENLAKALVESDLAGKLRVDKIRHYFDHPGFVTPFAQGLAKAIDEAIHKGISTNDLKIFFTTHSIPTSMADTSGPQGMRENYQGGMYVAQHTATAALVAEHAKLYTDKEIPSWDLVYQSRSGAPTIPWLEPDIGDAINNSASSGTKGVIVIPIGFVSDHVEVVWDLDNEAKEIAEEHNLFFARVATPGIAPEFVSAIADLIQERVNHAPKQALSELGPWADFCAVGCCPNARNDLPTVAQAE
jgi:ferrochelatase